ncbi:MAG: alpha-glucosidase [Treponema sp.]|jgi:oligo-1,6-glucosidase|nr:alpha-glucosidase [Treponema sp.]
MNKWWKERVVYQIYPRSFQDSPGINGSPGDGFGDIPGIISRLDEIKDLGAGIIWLSPMYPSPDADNGYDISDYRAIDPRFGTMEDMDALITEAARRDIRIIMDLVINHTSDEHEWFQKSRDKNSPYRDYYIWRPAKPDGSLPNNWTSIFMGPAWEFDGQSGEYYLHLFHKKQPDLNYRNPKVVEEVKDILRFWLDKGVAGFRCDVINLIYKTTLDDGKKTIAVRGFEKYKSQEGNHAVLRELRRDVLDKYDCFTVGETAMVTLEEAGDFCNEARKELDMLFYFEHLEVDRRFARYIPKKFHAEKLLAVLDKWQNGLEWNAVYLENHDQPRIVSHYGDEGEYWERSAKLLATLEFTLRGTPFVYQGQEIGMTNFDFTGFDQLDDVETLNLNALMKKIHIPASLRWKWLRESSRDNARTPMQWSAEPGAGFTAGKPWLGINGNYKRINYAAQKDDPGSVLNYYKKLIALRAGSEPLKYGSFKPRYAGSGASDGLIVYERELAGEVYTAALNFSRKPVKRRAGMPAALKDLLQGEGSGKLVLTNAGEEGGGKTGAILPWEALILFERLGNADQDQRP